MKSRLGLKTLGLCALVFGIMAFATSAAQAETGASWSIINSLGNLQAIPGGNDLLPEVQIKSLENDTATLLFTTAGGTKVEILCTKAELKENVKLIANGSLTTGKAVFHGCLTLLNGVLSPPCEPFTGANKGLIESLKASGLLILHLVTAGGAVEPLTRLTPETGNVFAHISLGEECSIGEEVLVSGSLTLKDAGNLSVEAKDRLISQGALTNLVALGRPAHIVGQALIKLAGAHNEFAWGGLPASTKP